jgi:hypothetical protein
LGIKTHLRLFLSSLRYAFTGKSGSHDVELLVSSFCLSGGIINDFYSRLIGFLRPACNINNGVVSPIKTSLERDGFYRTTSTDLDINIEDLIMTSQELVAYPDDNGTPVHITEEFHYKTSVYRYLERDIINLPAVQKIISSPALYNIAAAYLGSRPFLDIVAMWWSFPGNEEYQRSSAQSYHFDMDRIRWVKFFFYLTDVNAESGPHCFVRGSHRSGAIPKSILNQGYVRLTDQQVKNALGEDKIVTFTGKKGDVIIEDTRGLHKGLQPTTGKRFLFQLQFTNSLFGAPPRNVTLDPTKILSELKDSRLYQEGGLSFYQL